MTAAEEVAVPEVVLGESVLKRSLSELERDMTFLETVSSSGPSDSTVRRRVPCSARRVMLDSPLTWILRGSILLWELWTLRC